VRRGGDPKDAGGKGEAQGNGPPYGKSALGAFAALFLARSFGLIYSDDKCSFCDAKRGKVNLPFSCFPGNEHDLLADILFAPSKVRVGRTVYLGETENGLRPCGAPSLRLLRSRQRLLPTKAGDFLPFAWPHVAGG